MAFCSGQDFGRALVRHLVRRFRAGNFGGWARHAAAMVFIPELEANLSPPVQYEGTLIQSSNILASSSSSQQHHKESTHFAGRDQ